MSGGRSGRSAAALVAMVAATTTALVGCASRRSGAPLPAGFPVVDVGMREYRFDFNSSIPAGQVVFRLHNLGKEYHDLTLQPLSEDFPPIDVQLHGSERRAVAPFAGVPPVAPGATDTFAVDLAPGQRYALICFALDANGHVHALEGMNAEFRTPGKPLTPPTTATPAETTTPLETAGLPETTVPPETAGPS